MNELFENHRLNLIDFIQNKYTQEGMIHTEIPSLDIYTSSTISEFTSVIYEPSLCMILQGSKAVGFGEEMYTYDTSKFLLAMTYIPANVKILESSKEKPYMALKLKFSLEQIYDVMKDMKDEKNIDVKKTDKGLFFHEMTTKLLDPINRLVKLLNSQTQSREYLSNLILKEILYILLSDKSGDFLKQYVMEGTNTNKIVKVIAKIKDSFSETLNIEELAKNINISESSLYHNFKRITMMSPLQFQKKLRLEEAKQMLLVQNIDASEVAFAVGYESPSQFSREYSRMFGLPPKAHISAIKEQYTIID